MKSSTNPVFANLLGLVAFVALFTTSVLGQTNWQATGTGDFTVPGNWSSGVPNSTTNAFITNGTSGTPTVVNLSTGETGTTANLTVGSFDTFNVQFSTLNLYG